MTNAPAPPPGWYPDPSGIPRQVYWGGQNWHIPPPPKTSRTRWVVIGVVVGLVILGWVVSAVGGKPASHDSPSARSTAATATTSPRDTQREQAERAAKLDPASYKGIGAREFALLIKDPDSHKGEKIIVYGVVTQFDAATGTSEFRANTGPDPNAASSYSENTYVTAADPSILANVVEKDTLKMYVNVVGAYTYSTQIGGETTVPQFAVNIIDNLLP